MLERTLVKSLGWPEGRLLVLAHKAGTRLAEMGLSEEAILVWLDQVYSEPEKFVNDPDLSRLALALLYPRHEKDVTRAILPGQSMHAQRSSQMGHTTKGNCSGAICCSPP
jgi:hypothetical protein